MGITSRATYLNQLRRAFLLRVHPDRFRNSLVYHDRTREAQAALVKALSNRLADADFTSWQLYQSAEEEEQSPQSTGIASLHYVIQHRDGSTVVPLTFPLQGASVHQILNAMVDALQQSGATVPTRPTERPIMRHPQQKSTRPHGTRHGTNDDTHTAVDHQYDITSQRGRSLAWFLQNLSVQEITQRRQARLDAQAVATAVRRTYQFQAVDATQLGWSSETVAVLLQRLLDLYKEHGPFPTFHPLRLVFTDNNNSCAHAIDVYGGTIHLSPAQTPLQWLSRLQQVTPDVLQAVQRHRHHVTRMQKLLQRSPHLGGWKWNKGYTCPSHEYYTFLETLTHTMEEANTTSEGGTTSTNTMSVPARTGLSTVTVESSTVCRRPTVTRSGSLQLGADMTLEQVQDALTRYRTAVQSLHEETQGELQACAVLAQQVCYQWGLSRVDYRRRRNMLDPRDVRACLGRLVQAAAASATTSCESSSSFQQGLLAGQALGIVPAGQFCHLGDDGTVQIPHDWQ